MHSREQPPPPTISGLNVGVLTLQANDIYAIMNAVPAMALCAYGFLTPGMTGGLCFGAGLGITLFGIM